MCFLRSWVCRLVTLSAVLALSLGGHSHAEGHGSGSLLRFVPLSTPLQIVLDRQAGRAFVSDLGPVDQHGRPVGRVSIRMLDTHTGALLRTISIGGLGVYMVVDENSSRLFVALPGQSDAQDRIISHGNITILDTRTGARVRTVPAGWSGQMLVDPARGRVFVADRGDFTTRTPGALIVLDARTGAVVHRTPLGHDAWGLLLDRRTGHVFVTAQAIAEKYYWLSKTTLYMLDARDGTVLHTSPLSGALSVASAVVDERTSRAFLSLEEGQANSTLAIADTRTGVLLRTLPVGGRATSLAVNPATGRVFLTSTRPDAHQYPTNSALTTFDARAGALVGSRDLQRATPDAGLVSSARAQRVFLMSGGVQNRYEHLDRTRASLKIFDAVSGALLRSLPGAYGYGALVDERTGRLLVAQLDRVGPTGRPLGRARVVVLDGRTAHIVLVAPVGCCPSAFALDDATDHLFVLNQGLRSQAGEGSDGGGVFVLDLHGFS